MKILGLVGGTSWVSTAEYYRLINEKVNQRLGDSQYATCVIYSFNFADIRAVIERRDWDDLFERVAVACAGLRAAGAEGIVLCTSTTHLVADRLQARIGLPVIHIADATAVAVRHAGLNTVALLGTRFTMEMDFIKERLARYNIRTVIPSEPDREFINTTIFSELCNGIFRPETKARYLTIISSLVAQGAEGAILGCTEIPLLIKPQDCSVPVFDTTALHAAAAVEFALDGLPG